MRMIRNPRHTPPCVLVLGMFDGVHRGHQALLMRGRERADQLGLPLHVCTFEPHPLAVLRPEMSPSRLTTQTERAQLMASYGVDALCVNDFTRRLASQKPEDFVRDMVRVYQPRVVITGFNFTFGDRGSGNCETLAALQGTYGYESITVPEVVLEGATVSSTRIRGLLAKGDIPMVNRLLGHGYTMAGRVESGKHIGRTMGFPTANIAVNPHKALPTFGVYACYLMVEGVSYPAVVNVGRHPTLPEGNVTVEAYVLDSLLELYGKYVRLTFMDFLRPERVFADKEELRKQIARDVGQAREFFAAKRW